MAVLLDERDVVEVPMFDSREIDSCRVHRIVDRWGYTAGWVLVYPFVPLILNSDISIGEAPPDFPFVRGIDLLASQRE